MSNEYNDNFATMTTSLPRDFFRRFAPHVAKELLGKVLVFGNYQGIILETEAYRGVDDPASHAFRGLTPRTAVMFGQPGISYVYFIYGMYHCLNIVTEEEKVASAVLIRTIQLKDESKTLLNGPGKLCRKLGITREHNNIDLISNSSFYIKEGIIIKNFQATPRIGIRVGLDKLWRFVVNR